MPSLLVSMTLNAALVSTNGTPLGLIARPGVVVILLVRPVVPDLIRRAHGNVDNARGLDHVVTINPVPHLVVVVLVGWIGIGTLLGGILPADLPPCDNAVVALVPVQLHQELGRSLTWPQCPPS